MVTIIGVAAAIWIAVKVTVFAVFLLCLVSNKVQNFVIDHYCKYVLQVAQKIEKRCEDYIYSKEVEP